MELKVGDNAPEFALPDADGNLVSLSDFRGRNVLLYFYPKDNTPGCTKEACAFRDDWDEYVRNDTVILGLSGDTVESHRKFAEKYDLPFTLLSDKDKSVATFYGAYGEKKMYGRMFMGIKRMTFLIGKDGTILEIWKKVKVSDHSSEILDVLPD